MPFYAANFIYNGIISSEYGLRITSSSGESSDAGSDVALFTQEIYRRPRIYLMGVQQSPTLEIPFEINTRYELSATEDSVISNWLFGQMNYKKLQIVQSDMQYVYYNAIFTGKTTVKVGNIIRGYSGIVKCDSPFAWEYAKTITRNSTTVPLRYNVNGYLTDDYFTINNTSDNADYTYPTITFTMNKFGGDLSITNSSDNNREFLFTDLSPNEVITVDNDLQTISSSIVGVNRLLNFVHYELDGSISDTSYNWFRYVPKENDLAISGNVISVAFQHQFARKIA